MKRLFLLLLLICLTGYSLGALFNRIKKIKLEYVPFDLETDGRVDCNSFESSFDKFKTISISDKQLLDRFAHFLSVAQINKKGYHADVRTKIYIYYDDGTVETACMSGSVLEMNKKSVMVSNNFLSFIKNIEK